MSFSGGFSGGSSGGDFRQATSGTGQQVRVDPVAAATSAAELQDVQQGWADYLSRNRPTVASAVFGSGLQDKARLFLSLVDQGHSVQLNHARRMAAAGENLVGLAERVEDADQDNSVRLNAGGGRA